MNGELRPDLSSPGMGIELKRLMPSVLLQLKEE